MKQWLIDLRGDRSPIEIAKTIGIAYPSYWKIEHTERVPRITIAKKIAEELDFDWKLFFGGGLSYKKNKTMQNEYKVIGDTTIIFAKLKNKVYEIIVDTDDLERIQCYLNKWHIRIPKKSDLPYPVGYVYIEKTIAFGLYHLIMGTPLKGYVVDHINSNTLDNRKENLRIITRDQNQQNRSGAAKHNSTGMRGVHFHKQSKKYRARIRINNKEMHLGLFEDKEEAAKVVQEAIRKHMPYSKEALAK